MYPGRIIDVTSQSTSFHSRGGVLRRLVVPDKPHAFRNKTVNYYLYGERSG